MTRVRVALRRVALRVAAPAGRLVRVLPGMGAMACAIAGTWLLLGLGFALLAAVPFLILLDAKMPPPAGTV